MVLPSWLAPYLVPHRDVCWSLSALDACCALRLGWRPVPSSHFQDSVSCLTCSHDSLLLRHPAIDLGGFDPVFLAFGCYWPLAFAVCWVVFVFVGALTSSLHGCLFWPSGLDTWPDGPTILLLGLGLCFNPCGVFVLCLCLCSLLAINLVFWHIPPSLVNNANRAIYVWG